MFDPAATPITFTGFAMTPTAAGTSSIACDGNIVYVINRSSLKITRATVAGVGLASLTLPSTMVAPSKILCDGSALWVTDVAGAQVVKLNLNGVVLGTYATMPNPTSMVFDGISVYVGSELGGTLNKF
jgi:hypothetical protein